MNEILFKYIFEKEKNKGWQNSKQFRGYIYKTYNLKNYQEGTELYIAINRYQVKKYGCSVNPDLYIDLSKETLRRKALIRKAIRQERKKGRNR